MLCGVAKENQQLSLNLRTPAHWGGPRVGAGRSRCPRARVPHRRREAVDAKHPCHVTFKVRRELRSLRSRRLVRELERTLADVRNRRFFRVVHYSVQRDHLHLVVETEGSEQLSRGLKSVGARIARAVNRTFGRAGAVLLDRAHVRTLKTPTEVRRALAYVLLNARRHAAQRGRSLPRLGVIDPASSGRWFDGWLDAVPLPADSPVVACPRSWLLRLGWKRAGLISCVEVPGGRRRAR